jgi:nucleoid DNA-binding protein
MQTNPVLARQVRKATGLPLSVSAECVDVILETLFDRISRGETVVLRGFGTFYVSERAGRKFALCEGGVIPAHGKARFQPCEKLRKAVWSREGK